ncbi:MAG: TonB-dependent receptor [Steroidobacteraceae bacterium]
MYDVRTVGAAVALALVSVSLSTQAGAQQVEHAGQLEEVVITASPIGDADRLATIAGSVSREQLLRSGGNTIGDVLSQLPGVTSTSYAAGAGRPVIRGMDANRVRTLEDGIGTFDVSDVGPDHGVPLEPFAAERVEVVRGAASLRYGSQAIGGVVNAISNRVPLNLDADTVRSEAVADFGTGADSRNLAAQVNARGSAFALHADAFDRHADDYDTPEGVMANSWLRTRGAAVGGAWIGDANRLGLGVVRNESRYGIPGEASYIDMAQTKLSLRSAWQLDTGPWRKLTVDGGWADYEHSERDEQGVAQSTFRDKEWDTRAEAVSGPWGFLNESAVGVQLQRRAFSALGEGEEYLAPTLTTSHALFGFGEALLAPQWRLQLGARVEDVDVRGTPAGTEQSVTRNFTPLSGSLGLVFEPATNWRLGLALSSAARAPAQTELYARGVHDATATFETGDPGLLGERANSAELTLRWRGARVHADGSLWMTDFRNYIYGAFTGRSCSAEGLCVADDGEEFKELVYQQRGASFRGAEGHAQIELLRHAAGDLHLDLLADTVRATLAGNAGNVPRIPPWRVGAGLSWQGARVDARVSVRYSAKQDRTAEEETPTSGFTNVDAELAWRPLANRNTLELALVGRNLTDSLQRNAVALNKDEVILPGRDLRLMVRARFD